MSNILQIGLTVEGTTDVRFLSNVIHKTFDRIVLDCCTEIEVYTPEYLKKQGDTFIEQIVGISTKYHYFHIICVHVDADSQSNKRKIRNCIEPAFKAVQGLNDPACKNLVAIIPVYMTEAWMLADIDLFTEIIGTNLTATQLGLPNHAHSIETIRNPKKVINDALKISQEHLPRRRKKIDISDLYSPISQSIQLDKLMNLESFRTFELDSRAAIARLNYM